MGCVKWAREHVHRMWRAWETKYFSLGRVFSGVHNAIKHICFYNIGLVWRLPHLNTGRNTHMLLGPLGARGQQTWWCHGHCAPGGARGFIDLRGTHFMCSMSPPWLTYLRKQSTRKSFPPSFLQTLTQLCLVRLWENFLFIELSVMINVPMHGFVHV